MPTKPARLLFLALLALITLAASTAWADVTSPCPGDDPTQSGGTGFNSQNQKNMTADAMNRTKSAQAVISNLPTVDPRLYTCMTNIENMFDIVGASGTNPLTLLGNTIWSAVKGLLNQTCNMALSDLQNIEKSGLSVFNTLCMPLPGMGQFGLNLNLPQIPCNGMNFLNPQLTTSTSGSSVPYGQSLWGH